MIFWLGFTIMVFNEGFVIMRHVHPWFAKKRDHLIATYGKKWKRFHATLDYMWIAGVSLGFILDLQNWKLYASALLIFWGIVGLTVYLPLLIKKLRK